MHNKVVTFERGSVLAGYLEARKLAAPFGGLATARALRKNFDVCSPLCEARWRDITTSPAHDTLWTREILVYPAFGKLFKKGEDAVDSRPGKNNIKWILPASHLPEEAIGRPGAHLLIDPENVAVESSGVVVHPKSTKLLVSSISSDCLDADRGIIHGIGAIDGETGMPVNIMAFNPESGPKRDYGEGKAAYGKSGKAFFIRQIGTGVRPIILCAPDYGIEADVAPGYRAGIPVLVEDKDIPVSKIVETEDGIVLEGITASGIHQAIEAARIELNKLLGEMNQYAESKFIIMLANLILPKVRISESGNSAVLHGFSKPELKVLVGIVYDWLNGSFYSPSYDVIPENHVLSVARIIQSLKDSLEEDAPPKLQS